MPQQRTVPQPEDLSPTQHRIWTTMAGLGETSLPDLAERLGMKKAAVRDQLQGLRTAGHVVNNGKRGAWSRWRVSPTKTEAAIPDPDGVVALRVHRELAHSREFRTPEQLAAMLSLPLPKVVHACQALAAKNLLQPLGPAFGAPAVPLDPERLVDEWVETLSDAARGAISTNDRSDLVKRVSVFF